MDPHQSCLSPCRRHTQYHRLHPHPYRFVTSPSLLWRCLCQCLVSWWWVCVLPFSPFFAPCIIIKHGLPPPSFGLARWHTRQCAPAQPPFCGLACGKRGFRTEAVVGLLSCTLGNRPQTLIRPPSLLTHNMHCCLSCCLLPPSTTTTRGTACFAAWPRRLVTWREDAARFPVQVRWLV